MMEKTNTTGSRFLMLLKKYIVENNRRILLGLGALLALLAIFGFLGGVVGGNNTAFGLMLYLFMMSVLGMVGASQMFAEMKTKEGRTALLMVPANAVEKFIVRWLVWVVASTLMFWPSFELAELARRIGCLLAGNEFTTMHFDIFGKHLGELSGLSLMLSLFTSYLSGQSFFVLGSILWPRLSFLKTVLALWILQAACTVALIFGALIAKDSFEMVNNLSLACDITENQIICGVIVGNLVNALLNWTLTWLRLRESDNI